jgi:hypothetical protein
MTPARGPGDLAAAVRAALAPRVRDAFPAAAVTTIVAAGPPRELEPVLAALLEWLPRAGVPRGRALVVLAAGAEARAGGRATARVLRAALAVPVVAHDPALSACFTAGHVGTGLAVEVSDELREAEAVVAVGPLAPGADARTLAALVVPGLASAATRTALAASPGAVAPARALVAIDLALGWRARGDATWEARAARDAHAP